MTGGIFAILDDIAILLDDAAVMSKVAAKKTAGILGDDLAVNAEKATGFHASRELPVIWEITKGSFVNKIIILPLAFLLSAYLPWLIVPILLFGGAYLGYEGAEKIYHWITGSHREKPAVKIVKNKTELLKAEDSKIKSAVRTDFILSIEIIMITLGMVVNEGLPMQIIVVTIISFVATVGVYGIVALLVRMDDIGFYFIENSKKISGVLATFTKQIGKTLVVSLPWVIRVLGVIGTVAMLLVGGGMFTHNIELLHHITEFAPSILADLFIGLIVGSLLLAVQISLSSFLKKYRS